MHPSAARCGHTGQDARRDGISGPNFDWANAAWAERDMSGVRFECCWCVFWRAVDPGESGWTRSPVKKILGIAGESRNSLGLVNPVREWLEQYSIVDSFC